MGLRAPRPAALVAALVFALSVFGFTLYVWISFGGTVPLEPQGYRFRVQFGPEATNLVPNSQARIAGIEVGRVVDVDKRRETVDAVIELDSEYAPIPLDARAIVRFKTLLGEAFVELAPGSRDGAKLPDGGTLPVSRVQNAQQVDRVLATFDRRTRAAFKRTLTGLSDALEDRSLDLNAALGNSGPTIEDLSRLAAILERQDASVAGLVRDSGRALNAIGRRRDALRQVVTAGDDVLSATAARNRELTQTVRALPGFLTDLRGALGEVDAAAAEAAPTLDRLRPVAPLVRPALAEALTFAPELERLLGDLRPAVPELRRALAPTTDVLRNARRLMRALDPAGRELVPVVQLLTEYRREALASLANLAAATNGSASPPRPDGSRLRYVRVLPLITTEQIFGYARREPSQRHNPYPRPGAMEDVGRPALRAFDCRHTSNPQTLPVIGTSPPCLVQEPWTFQGRARSYPHLERFEP